MRDEHALAPGASGVVNALARHQRRLRLAAMASGIVAASAGAALLAVAFTTADASVLQARAAAGVGFVMAAAGSSAYWWRQWTLARVAAAVERRVGGLDNVVVTAEEIINRRPGAVHPIVRDALFLDAADRLRATPLAAVQPLAASCALAAAVLVAALAVVFMNPAVVDPLIPQQATTGVAVDTAIAPGDLRVTVTPPSYTGRSPQTYVNPAEVPAIEGSRIRLETTEADGPTQLTEPGHEPVVFEAGAERWSHEFIAEQSRVLLIQRPRFAGAGNADRLLQLRVEPDRRPIVRISRPAKDMVFSEPTGQVTVEIEARDDLAMASLVLRYTRVSGSGEGFTFEEGETPVRIQTTEAGEWRGQATLALDQLKLADGDTLVYRAIATDRKPGGDPSSSESFLIEVGRLAGVASTGFAVPEERDRQAISQQMVIIKTERLHASRGKLSREAFEEQAQLLAVEQRMVKAEFVFMTGGEVADEVEEAEHAHELAEGRLENAAAAELLNAIREMSRAEARLNAADTAQALGFERAALAALQRAFDRRRYLLRTLPERARIDLGRRLTGDLAAARPAVEAGVASPADPIVTRARVVMAELATAIRTREGMTAALASRVVGVDPASEALQDVVVPLSAAPDVETRLAAAREAQRHLAALVRGRLPASPRGRIVSDPLLGRFADESSRTRGRR